jgi:hypothetical protein
MRRDGKRDDWRESADEHGGVIDQSKEEVGVIKLHGSIDWFDRPAYAELEERLKEGLSG